MPSVVELAFLLMWKRFEPYLMYYRPVRGHFVGGVVAAVVYAIASGLGLPLMAKVIFPQIFGESSKEANWYEEWIEGMLGQVSPETLVLVSCLWIPFIFAIRSVSGYLNTYLLNFCGFKVVEGIRDRVFDRLQALPISFYQNHQSGDLLARLTGDTEMLRQTVTKVSGDLIKQPAQLLAALAALVYLSVTAQGSFVAIISLLSIPLCVFPIRMIGRRLAKKARVLQNIAGDLSGQVAESLQAPMEIRAYNLQNAVKKRFREQVSELIRYSMKVIKYRQFVSPAVELVAATGLSVALYLGYQNGMKLNDFMALGMALFMSYEPIKKLGAVHNLVQQGVAALDRLEEVLDADGELKDAKNPKIPEPFSREIIFEEVSFFYGEEAALSDINIKISPGECVALIGSSGAGKSTFANLIPRFYDVTQGRLLVGGQDVREWSKAELRDRIALVSQSPILFSGTIRENILLGKPGASESELIEAAKKAYAHEFIMELEDGYETEVAEKGSKVSGGQRQRIAIARAFLKDAPILILDEATSALDNESEAKIQQALARLIKDRTTLIIAHRLSTTKIADRVLEFDRGRIISERAEA